MKKKEYISPKAKLILLDASVLQDGNAENMGGHSDDDSVGTKRNGTWELEYFDDDSDW